MNANLEIPQVSGSGTSTISLEWLLEQCTCRSTITETVRHCSCIHK